MKNKWDERPRFSVSLPKELLERLDAYLAKRPIFQSRGQYVVHLILEDLDSDVVERFDRYVNDSTRFGSRNEAIIAILSDFLDKEPKQ